LELGIQDLLKVAAGVLGK